MSDAVQSVGVRSGKALLLWMLLLCTLPDTARAEDSRRFDLAAQPLNDALSQYSALTGMAVLFDSALVAGLQAARVEGEFSDSQALAALLAGTGLQARYSGEHAFTLRQLRPAAAGQRAAGSGAARSTQTVAARRYANLVQHTLWQALCATPLTRPGQYRAAVQLHLDAHGRVSDARLLASTGDPARDVALREKLAGLHIALAPPPNMAQPVTLLLKPAGSGRTPACPATDQGYDQANHQGIIH